MALTVPLKNLTVKLFFVLLIIGTLCKAQVQKAATPFTYKINVIAFYNLENLFDTIDNPNTYDEDRTPTGKDRWTSKKFNHKIAQLARVISSLGVPIKNKIANNNEKSISKIKKPTLLPLVPSLGPEILGVCEVENIMVLEALVAHELLRPFNYGIIHFESPDERGIDVALLYKKDSFIPASFNTHSLYLYNHLQQRDYTRDQLVVMGYLDTQPIWFIVNHWPSRSGGEARSRPFREAAALLNVKIIDSIRKVAPKARIVGMGDFNDDPTNNSFKKILQTKSHLKDSSYRLLYNPMEALYKKGLGSLAYRDQWSLFDQFYMSENLLEKRIGQFSFLGVKIFSDPNLMTKNGLYKGYPFRSYSAGQYQGGYSDHFPVQLFLINKTPLK